MVAETRLSANDLILPLFLKDGEGVREEIAHMPGVFRYSIDNLQLEIESCLKLGVKTFALFPCVEDSLKDPVATEGLNAEGLYTNAIRVIKSSLPEAVLMTDVAMDPYSSDGHDGLVKNGEILNDETLEILAKMALVQAEAGADIIGPSDMMDGRVGTIRKELDKQGFHQCLYYVIYREVCQRFLRTFQRRLGLSTEAWG